MGDMGVGRHLVPADNTAKLYDLEMQLEYKKSALVRIEQDIKDITNISLKSKERDRHMIGKDIEESKKQIQLLTKIKMNDNGEIIDV